MKPMEPAPAPTLSREHPRVAALEAQLTELRREMAVNEQRDALTTVTHRPGYFTRDELIARYAARSGRDLSGIRYYEIFAVFKIAVVIQQIYYRFVQGQTTDARFAAFGARVEYLARHATNLASLQR